MTSLVERTILSVTIAAMKYLFTNVIKCVGTKLISLISKSYLLHKVKKPFLKNDVKDNLNF